QDLQKEVSAGNVKFTNNSLWILGSCNTAFGNNSIAFLLAKNLEISTIGATGLTSWETDGKVTTGYLKTDGEFVMFQPVYNVTTNYQLSSKELDIAKDLNLTPSSTENGETTFSFNTKEDREKFTNYFNKTINKEGKFSTINSTIIKEKKLGDKIK